MREKFWLHTGSKIFCIGKYIFIDIVAMEEFTQQYLYNSGTSKDIQPPSGRIYAGIDIPWVDLQF